MKRIGLVALSAVLVAVPAASAKTKHLKLTATATGQKSETVPGWGPQRVTLYSVKQGSKRVGTLDVSELGGCVGNTCEEAGFANLRVGKVTGKAHLKTTTEYTGCSACVMPTPAKFKSNTGTIFEFNAQHKLKAIQEAIRVKGPWPTKKGSKVTFILSY